MSDDPFDHDVQMRVPSVEKAKQVLGFEATTTLDQMLDVVVPWVAGRHRPRPDLAALMTALSDPGGRRSSRRPATNPTPPRSHRRPTGAGRRHAAACFEAAFVALLLVLAVAVHRGSMGQQLVEQHGFRQTQTALTAVDFQQHGIDLLHPRVPVFGPRSEVPFEFPLFQALATVPMNLGVDADASMRFTALACFLLTAVLLFGLIRRVGRTDRRVRHAGRVPVLALRSAVGPGVIGGVPRDPGAVGLVWAGIESARAAPPGCSSRP